MAEQKSIISIAIIFAIIVAGGSFYFFTAASDEKQADKVNNEDQIISDELSMQLDEAVLSLSEEQEGERDESSATLNESAVLGAQTVEPTAETGVSSTMMLLMGLAAALGFTGLVSLYKNKILTENN